MPASTRPHITLGSSHAPSLTPEDGVKRQVTIAKSLDYAATAAIQSKMVPFQTVEEMIAWAFTEKVNEWLSSGWVGDPYWQLLAARNLQRWEESRDHHLEQEIEVFTHEMATAINRRARQVDYDGCQDLITRRWEQIKTSNKFWSNQYQQVFKNSDTIKNMAKTLHAGGYALPADLVSYLGL